MESGYELEARLWNEVDCSVSETSDESVLLKSSRGEAGLRTGYFWELRRTGLPFLPLPSLEGLPGAPFGILSLYFWGTTMRQFSHVSESESMVLLGLLPPKLLPDDDGKLGKYGLCVGERGLVGGESKGELSCGMRAFSLRGVGWS
jgi:hypothetical protein